jgi:hypothetical protein
MADNSEYDRAFDRIMTLMRPHLERLAELELSRRQRATTRHVIVSVYIQARMKTKGESRDDAVEAACRKYKISKRTAETAWSWAVLNKRKEKRALFFRRVGKRRATATK